MFVGARLWGLPASGPDMQLYPEARTHLCCSMMRIMAAIWPLFMLLPTLSADSFAPPPLLLPFLDVLEALLAACACSSAPIWRACAATISESSWPSYSAFRRFLYCSAGERPISIGLRVHGQCGPVLMFWPYLQVSVEVAGTTAVCYLFTVEGPMPHVVQ